MLIVTLIDSIWIVGNNWISGNYFNNHSFTQNLQGVIKKLALLGLDDVTMFEDNREETKSIPKKQASPKNRNAMGDKNNQQMNVKLELENGNVQGEGRKRKNII